MRKIVVFAALSTALVCMSDVSAFAESTEEELIRLEKEAYEVVLAKDYDKMRLLMADDWAQQDDSDDKITRELMIDRLKAGKFVPGSGVFGPMSVDVLGDAAAVMGSVEERFTYDGKTFALHSNFVDVWARRDGRWMSVRVQMASRPSTE